MKLLVSTKKDVDSDKNSENVPKLESVEVVLVHYNLVKNDYQHSSKVLFSFVPNKQLGQLINISPNTCWVVIIKMRYSTEPRFRKYVKGYGFLSFARNFGNKYGKKLMDSATKTGIDTAKTASKRVVQKTVEATGDLIGNKIADKITSIGKPKDKETKKKNQKKFVFHQRKDNKLLVTLDYFEYKFYFFFIKMEFQKITNILDITSDNKDLPKFVTKKWIKVYDQSEKNYDVNKEIRIKTSMLRSDLCD